MKRWLGSLGIAAGLVLFPLLGVARADYWDGTGIRLSHAPAVRATAVSGNAAPNVSAPSSVDAPDGGILTLTVTASDPDADDMLTVTPSGLPEGFSTTPTTGPSPLTVTASGRIPLGSAAAGPISVSWTAEDGVNAPVQAATTVDVLATPAPEFGASYGYAPGRVLVRFRAGVVTSRPSEGKGTPDNFSFASTQAMTTLATAGVATMTQLLPSFTRETVDLHGDPITLPEDLTDLYIADLVDSNVVAAVAILQTDSLNIRTAGPDGIGLGLDGRLPEMRAASALRALPDRAGQASASTFPNDTYFPSQWWLRNTGQLWSSGPLFDIRAYLAWDQTTGGSGMTQVGVLSTGIDYSHPDFRYTAQGPNTVGGASSSDDDALSAGTADAGMVGARGNNGQGVAGVNWGPGLVGIKVLDSNGAGTESSVIIGVDWAREHFLPIIFPDVHLPYRSDNLAAAFKNAHATGMLMSTGSGNDDGSTVSFPAYFVRLVEGVGAIDETGARWQNSTDILCKSYEGLGSSFGPQVDLCGPGGNRIVTTQRVATGSYYLLSQDACKVAWRSGVAGPAAEVAGAAALLRDFQPALWGEDLAQILERTAHDVGPSGWDDNFGWGVIDLEKAIGFVNNANVVDQGSTTNVTDGGIVDTPSIELIGVGLPLAYYPTKKHLVYANVQFAAPFVSPPAAWGRNAQSIGWRSHPNNDVRQQTEEPVGWAEIDPTSITRDGCTVRTYVYEVYSPSDGHFIGWYPCIWSQTRLAWTAVGPANATGVPETEAPQVLRVTANPNPVTYSGEFRLSLPATSDVSLRLFGADGRLVRVLADRRFPAGAHRITWEALGSDHRRLAAGVYLFRLETNSGVRNGKVLVVR